jgi:hypothetical protein
MKTNPYTVVSIFIGILWVFFVSTNSGPDGSMLILYGPASIFTGFLYFSFFSLLEKSYDNNILGNRLQALKNFILALFIMFVTSWVQAFILDLTYHLFQGYSYGWLKYATKIMLLIQVLVSLVVISLFLKFNREPFQYSKNKFILLFINVFIVGFMILPFVVQYKVGLIRDTENKWYQYRFHKSPTSIDECNRFLTGVRNSCIREFQMGKIY